MQMRAPSACRCREPCEFHEGALAQVHRISIFSFSSLPVFRDRTSQSPDWMLTAAQQHCQKPD